MGGGAGGRWRWRCVGGGGGGAEFPKVAQCLVRSAVTITDTESNPDMELLTQQTFGFSPDVLAAANNNTPLTTTSVVSDQGRVLRVL